MKETFWAISSIIIPLSIIVVMFYTFTDKKTRPISIKNFLISRTTFATLISVLIIVISLTYTMEFSNPVSKSEIRKVIDIVLLIPIAIPYIIGDIAGYEITYICILIEIFFMTLIIRMLISQEKIDILRDKFK